MVWYKWDQIVHKRYGKVTIHENCCCGGCMCDPMPSTWTVTVTTFCGAVSGTMAPVAGIPGCNPRWHTTAPIVIDCRVSAFTPCGEPFEVDVMVCYQNGLCIQSVTFRVPSTLNTELHTQSVSGTCDPFYSISYYYPTAVAGLCSAYGATPPYPVIVEFTP